MKGTKSAIKQCQGVIYSSLREVHTRHLAAATNSFRTLTIRAIPTSIIAYIAMTQKKENKEKFSRVHTYIYNIDD